jgi:phage gp29-like protein
MPNRTPAEDANERFVFKTDTMARQYETMQALTPDRVKRILQMAEIHGDLGPLYSIYERMEATDTRFGGLAGSFKAAIGGFRLKVIPAEAADGKEKEIADDYADTMREVIANLDAQTVTKEFVDPYFTGAKLYKLRWSLEEYAYNKKMWLPTEIAPVEGRSLQSNKDHDKPERFGKMEVRTRDNQNGRLVENLPLGSCIFLEHGYGNDRYDRLGVARKCLPWYLGIQFVQSWWIQYIEGYGSPLRIGRHPRGIDPNKRMNMERFLKVLGQHGYALFPNDLEVQLLEANRQGTITTYGDFIAKGHEEYAVAIMGQASTVGAKGSTAPYAGAVVAQTIRYENMQDAVGLAARGWHKLADLVMRINYGPSYVRRLLPSIRPVLITPTDMKVKAETAEKAQNNGVAVKREFWYEQVLGTEPPREGEEAVLHGKTFIYGVDPEPEPQQKGQTANEGRDQSDRDQSDRDRSVASPGGNPDTGGASS